MLHEKWEQSLIVGLPVQVDFFNVVPWKLNDILTPQKQFFLKLAFIFVTAEHLGFAEEDLKNFKQSEIYGLIRVRAILDKNFCEAFIQALESFVDGEVSFKNEIFLINDLPIMNEHFNTIKEVLQLEVGKQKPEEEEQLEFANEAAREFYERIKNVENEIKKIKNKQTTSASLDFLVNRLCAKSPNISLLNVGDLTYYQFLKHLEALAAVESYDINIQAMIAGALDGKKNKLVHWTENK